MRTKPFKVMVYLNEKEFNRFNELAQMTKLGKSNLVRYLLLGYEPAEAPPVDYYKLIHEMRCIGNTLNQLAMTVHTHRFINPKDLQYHCNELDRIEDEMHENFNFRKRRKSMKELETEIIRKKENYENN